MIWILGIISVVLFFMWQSSRSDAKGFQSHLIANEVQPWFEEVGMTQGSERFAVYLGRPYALIDQAAVVVGIGKLADGESVGFIVEVSPKFGCMPGKIIRPYGLATHHKAVSQRSMTAAIPMSALFSVMMDEHTKQRSGIADAITPATEVETVVDSIDPAPEQTCSVIEIVEKTSAEKAQRDDSHSTASAKRVADLRARMDREARSLR